MIWLFFPLLLLTSAPPAGAELFRNEFVELDVPKGWACALEGSEWVCIERSKPGFREGLIVLKAKIKSPADSMLVFQNYLKQPRVLPGTATQLTSQVQNVREIVANGQNWVSALHLSSEIENYYTQYFTTIKENLVILVTVSVHKASWPKYQPALSALQNSLKIIASPQLLAATGEIAPSGAGTTPTADLAATPSSEMPISQRFPLYLTLGLILAGALLIYLKKRQ